MSYLIIASTGQARFTPDSALDTLGLTITDQLGAPIACETPAAPVDPAPYWTSTVQDTSTAALEEQTVTLAWELGAAGQVRIVTELCDLLLEEPGSWYGHIKNVTRLVLAVTFSSTGRLSNHDAAMALSDASAWVGLRLSAAGLTGIEDPTALQALNSAAEYHAAGRLYEQLMMAQNPQAASALAERWQIAANEIVDSVIAAGVGDPETAPGGAGFQGGTTAFTRTSVEDFTEVYGHQEDVTPA